MIKETESSNKPEARDLCGARRGAQAGEGDRGFTFYKENHIMALTNTSDEAEIYQEIIYITRKRFLPSLTW